MNKKYAAILIFLLVPLALKLAPEKTPEITEDYVEETVNVLDLSGIRIVASTIKTRAVEEETNKELVVPKPTDQCKSIEGGDKHFTAFREKYKAQIDGLFGAWYLDQTKTVDPKFQPETDTAKFIYGLYKADLLSGRKIDKPDYNKALSMFAQTLSSDRKSSTAWYYILHTYEKLKYDTSFDYAIGQLLSTDHHNSYETKLKKELFKLAKTPEDFVGAMAMTLSIPKSPNKIINAGLERMNDKEKIKAAKILMKKGSDTKFVNDSFDWSSEVYQKGYKILEDQNRHQDFLNISDLKYKKAGSNKYFDLDLNSIKTLCDAKEAFEVVSDRLSSF